MRRALRLACALASLVSASCAAAPEPPAGFTLGVRLVSIDPAVIDELRLRFQPQAGARFETQEEMTFEEGQITVRIEPDGGLVMSISGAHVRANLAQPDGTQFVYPLEIWSDDPAMDTAPLVLGSVLRNGELIGEGTVYLPAWPPPLGGSTQIAIECRSEAAAAGRCSP